MQLTEHERRQTRQALYRSLELSANTAERERERRHSLAEGRYERLMVLRAERMARNESN